MPSSSLARLLTLACILAAFHPAGAQVPNPDFDAVVWTPLGCGASPATVSAPRGEVDLVGDATSAAAYTALDATYLYFRYRVNGDPSGQHGFAGSSDWNMLLQLPSGDPFQYQYQIALNGDGQGGDTVELWANSVAQDVTFDPPFTDEPDVQLFQQVFDTVGPGIVNTTPLARLVATTGLLDATDWFVDVAFPIAVLAANGIDPADLPGAFFYPATATRPERHNRDTLACPFLPAATLALDAAVAPASVSRGASTHVTYTIGVHGTGGVEARGTILTAPALPAYLSGVTATVSGDAPEVTGTVVSANPLVVRVPRLPAGRTATVQIDADAAPSCADVGATTALSALATNAVAASGTATLDLDSNAAVEVCDGVDNNCDGRVDEGGDALCDDGNPCNGVETCGGVAGCQPGTPPCDDGDPCTTDLCDQQTGGCSHVAIPGCTPCTGVAQCDDGDGCTTDSCSGGRCVHTAIVPCIHCTDATSCADANPCTDDVCSAESVCLNPVRPGCVLCSSSTQCDDGRACTQDVCAGGVCIHNDIPGCTECVPAPEVCGNGIDDDCDGLVDCADPDCAAAPACIPAPVERCDNCVDDDGDGLVDYEDPDCCSVTTALGVAHLTLKSPGVRVHGNQLRLDAQYAGTTPALFDPLRQDTTIELSDTAGTVLCATIPAQRWRRFHRLTYRFSDRGGGLASGLQSGEFRISRSGALLFRARGRDVGMRPVNGSGTVHLTVRVGNACSRSSMALRTGRKGLVFP